MNNRWFDSCDHLANPYKAPDARLGIFNAVESPILASRWRRFIGSMIDSFITLMILIVLLLLLNGDRGAGFSISGNSEGYMQHFVRSLMAVSLYFAVNSWLLVSRGQTIGKLILRMRIVKVDNSAPNPVELMMMRYVICSFFSLIPIVGGIFYFLDAIFIYGNDRRCIHDHFAGTKVILVRS